MFDINKIIIIILIFTVIVISACSQNQQTVCNKPYILVGNSCCLDKNNNSVCDKDEVGENKKEEVSCNLPYIKVGNSCCLDKNNNGICDSDEKEQVVSTTTIPTAQEEKSISISDLQSDINKVLNSPILLVKDFNTNKFQVYSYIQEKIKFLGKYGSMTYFKSVKKKPVMVIQISDKNSYLKDYNDFYDFVNNNKNIFIESAIKSKEIFENEFKNGELPKLIYLNYKHAFAENAQYNGSEEVYSNVFFDNITFPETVSKRIAQIFYVKVNKYKVNISGYTGIITEDLSNINLAYNMIIYCNPSLVISLNEECFGQGYYFCQGTGASHDADFDRSDSDAKFFLTNLKAYYPPYTNWAQALIDMCDQKYQFTYAKSTIT